MFIAILPSRRQSVPFGPIQDHLAGREGCGPLVTRSPDVCLRLAPLLAAFFYIESLLSARIPTVRSSLARLSKPAPLCSTFQPALCAISVFVVFAPWFSTMTIGIADFLVDQRKGCLVAVKQEVSVAFLGVAVELEWKIVINVKVRRNPATALEEKAVDNVATERRPLLGVVINFSDQEAGKVALLALMAFPKSIHDMILQVLDFEFSSLEVQLKVFKHRLLRLLFVLIVQLIQSPVAEPMLEERESFLIHIWEVVGFVLLKLDMWKD